DDGRTVGKAPYKKECSALKGLILDGSNNAADDLTEIHRALAPEIGDDHKRHKRSTQEAHKNLVLFVSAYVLLVVIFHLFNPVKPDPQSRQLRHQRACPCTHTPYAPSFPAR